MTHSKKFSTLVVIYWCKDSKSHQKISTNNAQTDSQFGRPLTYTNRVTRKMKFANAVVFQINALETPLKGINIANSRTGTKACINYITTPCTVRDLVEIMLATVPPQPRAGPQFELFLANI